MKNILYIVALIIVTIIIWANLYSAQFLEYDDNYGQLLGVFLISLLATIIVVVMLLKKIPLVKQNIIATIIFFIINSPITIILTAVNYASLFGAHLKVG